MATDHLAYITGLRAQGMAETAIAQRLGVAGWSPELIRDALQKAPTVQEKKRKTSRTAAVAVGLFSVLLLLSAGVYALSLRPDVYAISLPAAGATSTPLTYGSWPALEDPQFYDSVKQRFIEEKASFITADLTAMSLSVYMGGEVALTVPMVAKGKVGSWWETPVGLYEIQSKEESHFSSFGQVNQPWSLAFQGNFFIHGIPTYPDGSEVSSTFSGGCIRLNTEDARKVYNLASTRMPVFVYKTPAKETTFRYQYKKPEIDATAFIVADVENGTILTSQNANIQLPIASITKLVTALVTVEYLNLEKIIPISSDAKVVSTSVPRLRTVKEASVHDLLLLLLTESSNEAAEALAGALGRNYFISLMNKKAVAIGLSHSTFIDPSGLGVGNSSTAEDMFTLLKYTHENRRFLLDITAGTLAKDAYGEPQFKQLQNFNKIAGVGNAFLGGKIGKTNAAKETYAGLYTLPVAGSKRTVAVIVLGAVDAQKSIKELLLYLNTFYAAEGSTN